MKNSIKIISALLMVGILSSFTMQNLKTRLSGDVGIQFKNLTLEQAMTEAQKENKIIFVDVYTTWCGPCKMLEKKTFSDKELANYHNQEFVNIKIDAETKPGKEIMGKYHFKMFPTLLYIDEKGKLIEKKSGFYNAKELLDIGKQMVR